jgi:hypothetical protein
MKTRRNVLVAMIMAIALVAAGILGFVTCSKKQTTEPTEPKSDNWISKIKMPTGRTFSGACVIDEKFYVIGGTPGTSATTTVEMYNPTTYTWQKMADMPAAPGKRWQICRQPDVIPRPVL